MAESDALIVDETDDIVQITFDRPEKRNAIDLALITSLRDQFRTLHDRAEKAVLLTGNGPVTTAGADTTIVGGDDDERKRELLSRINETYDLLQSYPRPTVMAVKGAAIGAGFQLAVTCDFAIVSDESILSKPEIKYGVFSGYSTAMLEQAFGGNIGREIALKGDAIPPEKAHEWGIVTDVVPESDVDSRAEALVKQLADYDSGAYEVTKAALTFDGTREDFENYP